MEQRLDQAWKWVLRLMGVAGFVYLLVAHPNVPVAFYVLLAGLLGLPNIIAYQMSQNRERDAEDDYKKKHGYRP